MSLIIKDGLWQRIRLAAVKADREYVQVGVLQGSGNRAAGLSMVELAATHEFGSPSQGIPERSFIRRTFDEKRDQFEKIVSGLARKVVTEGVPTKRALNALGTWAASEVKKTITAGEHIPPPLSPKTIARKKSDRPLVDTGQLVNSITHKVVTK